MMMMMEEETLKPKSTTTSDKSLAIALDIESLVQASSERCSGSPKMTKALSRKWSYRLDRCASIEEEDLEQQSKKIVVRVNSQLEPLKQSLITKQALNPCPITLGLDTVDGRSKRFNRFTTINPRNILFIFATASSIGTMILIFFTIAINTTT